MRRAIYALTIILLCCGPAPAQAPQAAEPPAPAQQPADDQRMDGLQKPDGEKPKADESWWQKILRESPNCKSFTDGCRTCSQTVCSNIGIACQPKEWVCNDPAPDAKPDAKPEAMPDAKPDPKQ
jgi:hypothetical protein